MGQCTKNCTDPGDSGQSITCLTGACEKLRHGLVKSSSDTIVQRGCAGKSKKMNECYQVTVLGVLTTQCTCDTHLCNSQKKDAISKLLLPASLLIFSLFQVPH